MINIHRITLAELEKQISDLKETAEWRAEVVAAKRIEMENSERLLAQVQVELDFAGKEASLLKEVDAKAGGFSKAGDLELYLKVENGELVTYSANGEKL